MYMYMLRSSSSHTCTVAISTDGIPPYTALKPWFNLFVACGNADLIDPLPCVVALAWRPEIGGLLLGSVVHSVCSKASCLKNPFCSVWRCCSPEKTAELKSLKRKSRVSGELVRRCPQEVWKLSARVLFLRTQGKRLLGLAVILRVRYKVIRDLTGALQV